MQIKSDHIKQYRLINFSQPSWNITIEIVICNKKYNVQFTNLLLAVKNKKLLAGKLLSKNATNERWEKFQ